MPSDSGFLILILILLLIPLPLPTTPVHGVRPGETRESTTVTGRGRARAGTGFRTGGRRGDVDAGG